MLTDCQLRHQEHTSVKCDSTHNGQDYAFETFVCKMATISFRPQCDNSSCEMHKNDRTWRRRCFKSLVTQLFDPLQWRHNERDGVSIHQPHDCILNHLFRRRSKKTSKLHVTGLCVGNSPVTGEFPAQMASNVENVPIWSRHHQVASLE